MDGDGKLDIAEPRIQDVTGGVPQIPPPPGSGPGTGTLPGPLNGPVSSSGTVRIGVRTDVDITDAGGTTTPETISGGITIKVAP